MTVALSQVTKETVKSEGKGSAPFPINMVQEEVGEQCPVSETALMEIRLTLSISTPSKRVRYVFSFFAAISMKMDSLIKTKYLKTGFSGMGGFHDTTMEDSSMRIISQVNFVGGETGLSTEVLAKVRSAKQMILEEESASDLFEGDEEDPGSSTSSPLLRSNSPPKVEMKSIPV